MSPIRSGKSRHPTDSGSNGLDAATCKSFPILFNSFCRFVQYFPGLSVQNAPLPDFGGNSTFFEKTHYHGKDCNVDPGAAHQPRTARRSFTKCFPT